MTLRLVLVALLLAAQIFPQSIIIPRRRVAPAGGGGGSPCIVGYDTDGGSDMGLVTGGSAGSVFPSGSCSGPLTTGHVYSDHSVPRFVKVSIYTDDGDGVWEPTDAHVATTAGVDCAADAWCTLSFSSGSVSAGTDYFIVVWLDDEETNFSVGYQAITHGVYSASYSDGVCDGYDSNGNSSNCTMSLVSSARKLSIYVTAN